MRMSQWWWWQLFFFWVTNSFNVWLPKQRDLLLSSTEDSGEERREGKWCKWSPSIHFLTNSPLIACARALLTLSSTVGGGMDWFSLRFWIWCCFPWRFYCTCDSRPVPRIITIMDRFCMYFWMVSEDKPGLSEDAWDRREK